MGDNIIFNTGLLAVSVANAGELEPDDVYVSGGSSGYDKLAVFQLVGRVSNKLTIVNFGPGALYCRFSLDGFHWSGAEIFLPAPTANRDFVLISLDRIYEARVRSPDSSCKYQAFEGIFR